MKLNQTRPDLLPTQKPSKLEVAWAAGVYEGEGNVQQQRSSITVRLTQNESWVPQRLRDFFGGSVGYQRGWKGKRASRWIASGKNARTFLQRIYPYLSPRRQYAIDKALNTE